MSCSSANHAVPRWRSSAASPLSNFRPQVSPGSKSFSRKPLPLVMRNGWTYLRIRSRISFFGMPQPPVVEAQSTIAGSWIQLSTTQFAPAPYSDGDAQKSYKREPPARRRGAAHDRFRERQHAVNEREGAVEEHQREQRYSGPDEGKHPEQDGADAAQEQQPPVLGEGVQQHAWPKRWIGDVCHDGPPSVLRRPALVFAPVLVTSNQGFT